jgi:hypothetical protein
MKSNFHLLFYLRKQKTYKTGPVPIYMRIPLMANGPKYLPAGNVNPQNGIVAQGVPLALKKKSGL